MPAFLIPELYDEWLNPAKLATDEEREHLVSVLEVVSERVASTITTYEVDRRVNNSRAIDPSDSGLVEPSPGQ
jgi:hypothetical protein